MSYLRCVLIMLNYCKQKNLKRKGLHLLPEGVASDEIFGYVTLTFFKNISSIF